MTSGSPASGGLPHELLPGLLKRPDSRVEVVVRGRSMDPTLTDGSVVRIRGGGLQQAGEGTAMAFLAGGRELMIHRLVSCPPSADFVLTRGDGNLLVDPPVPVGDVLGQVTEVRTEVQGDWSMIPGAPVRPRLITRWHERAMRFALPIHVRLAQVVALLGLLVILPAPLLRFGFSVRVPPYLTMLRLTRPVRR